MGNDYYLKHKSDRHVILSRRDRIALQTLLAMEIAFTNENEKNFEPAFSVKHLKALYEKISGRSYNETNERW